MATDTVDRETQRLTKVFDQQYYRDLSPTGRPRAISADSVFDVFNEYLKWKHIVFTLLYYRKTELATYRILDAGCGNGNVLRKLVELGADPAHCYGMDLSQEVIAYAGRVSGQIHWAVGPMHATTHPEAFFDLIFSFGVLIHVLDDDYIRQTAAEWRRLIRPTGLLYVLVTNERTVWGEAMRGMSRTFCCADREVERLLAPHFACLESTPLFVGDYYAPGFNGKSLLDIETELMRDRNLLTHQLLVFRPTDAPSDRHS